MSNTSCFACLAGMLSFGILHTRHRSTESPKNNNRDSIHLDKTQKIYVGEGVSYSLLGISVLVNRDPYRISSEPPSLISASSRSLYFLNLSSKSF